METERKIEIDAKEAMIVYSLLDAGADGRGNNRKESKLLDPALSAIEALNGKSAAEVGTLTLLLSEGAYNILKARFEASRIPGSQRKVADSLENKIDNAEKIEKAGQ